MLSELFCFNVSFKLTRSKSSVCMLLSFFYQCLKIYRYFCLLFFHFQAILICFAWLFLLYLFSLWFCSRTENWISSIWTDAWLEVSHGKPDPNNLQKSSKPAVAYLLQFSQNVILQISKPDHFYEESCFLFFILNLLPWMDKEWFHSTLLLDSFNHILTVASFFSLVCFECFQ